MKPFVFQQFQILQDDEVFRVGTDGVLLGVLCEVKNASRVLEVGAGTGVISLMLAQRNPEGCFTALDVNPKAAELAALNFNQSPFSERMRVLHQDFKNFESAERFHLIVCNPPYFEVNDSAKDVLARQTVELDWRVLLDASFPLLEDCGRISVIIPSETAPEMEQYAAGLGLFLLRKVNVYGIRNGVLKRNVLEFSKTSGEMVTEDFVIEKSPRNYSDQYLEVTKDFHVFGKK